MLRSASAQLSAAAAAAGAACLMCFALCLHSKFVVSRRVRATAAPAAPATSNTRNTGIHVRQ